MQRCHPLASRFHACGEPGICGHSTNPTFEPRHIGHGRHSEDISINTAFKQHFGESEVASPHCLAHPAPVRFHAGPK